MDVVRRNGLVEQVIDRLSTDLASGVWAVGDRLPSVAELAGRLGVGRSTVREAVQVLAHRGALDLRQGRGTFVAVPEADAAVADEVGTWLRRAAVLDVYEARRGLEVDAARLAARRRTADDLDALRAAAAGRRAARGGSADDAVSEWAAADVALHRAVVTATHNPVLGRLFDALAGAMTDAFTQQTRDPGSTVDTADDHDALVEAIAAGDAEEAVRAAVGYLDACEDDLRRLLPGAAGHRGAPR